MLAVDGLDLIQEGADRSGQVGVNVQRQPRGRDFGDDAPPLRELIAAAGCDAG